MSLRYNILCYYKRQSKKRRRKIVTNKEFLKKIREGYNITKKNIVTLEGKSTLNKSDIYRVAGCLYGNITSKDDLDKLIENKKKTWKKYIDDFQNIFPISFSPTVPIVYGLLCVLFILLLDNQYFIDESEERPRFINRIIRKLDDDAQPLALNYQEKNQLLDYFENIIEPTNYEKYGIRINIKKDFDKKMVFEEMDGLEKIEMPYSFKIDIGIYNLELYKNHQIVLEMLEEIEPYSDEMLHIINQWRFNTALREMVERYETHIIKEFGTYAKVFFGALFSELDKRAEETIFTQKYHSEEQIAEEVEQLFKTYMEEHFKDFVDRWFSKCINFDFDPMILLKK